MWPACAAAAASSARRCGTPPYTPTATESGCWHAGTRPMCSSVICWYSSAFWRARPLPDLHLAGTLVTVILASACGRSAGSLRAGGGVGHAGGCWRVAPRRVPAGLGPWLRGIVGGPPEGADDHIRSCGGYVGWCDPLGPAEPVPPLTSGGIARGDDVAALGAVLRVLHEQGRQPPRRRSDVGAPATGVHLRRQRVQAGDAIAHRAGGAVALHGPLLKAGPCAQHGHSCGDGTRAPGSAPLVKPAI
jgi:hypothetical protein